MTDCPFCRQMDLQGLGVDRPPTGEEVDCILARGPEIVLTPTKGTLVPGYLMAISVEHRPSFGSLGSTILRTAIGPWLARIMDELQPTFGPYMLFEHGMGEYGDRRGGCVDHAHLHLVPADDQLFAAVLEAQPWQLVGELASVADYTSDGYAFVSFAGASWIWPAPAVPGQWIRRLIARYIDKPDEWDWGVFEHEGNLRKTLSELPQIEARSSLLGCAFCAQFAGDSASVAKAFQDLHPITDGHRLIVPRRHIERLEDLDQKEWRAVFEVVQLEVVTARQLPDVQGVNVGVNSGWAAGQTVTHAHVHVIPRRPGDVENPAGGVRWVIPTKAVYPGWMLSRHRVTPR